LRQSDCSLVDRANDLFGPFFLLASPGSFPAFLSSQYYIRIVSLNDGPYVIGEARLVLGAFGLGLRFHFTFFRSFSLIFPSFYLVCPKFHF
jgi:hypothetical protein